VVSEPGKGENTERFTLRSFVSFCNKKEKITIGGESPVRVKKSKSIYF